jgi:hypothetical protein
LLIAPIRSGGIAAHFNRTLTLELVPKLIDYALKRMVLEQALGKIGLKPAFSTKFKEAGQA